MAPAPNEGDADIGRESAGKRLKEAKRNDRKKMKDERRLERQSAEAPQVDEAAMTARFQQLNERREAGEVTEEAFEAERHEIFVALGLEDPHEVADEDE